MLAAAGGHPGTVDALLRGKADPMAVDGDGCCALHYAARHWQEHRAEDYNATAELLVQAGCSPEAPRHGRLC